MAGEMTPTITALVTRYDVLREAAQKGRAVLKQRREAEQLADAAFAMAHETKYLESAFMHEDGRKAQVDERKAWTTIHTMDEYTAKITATSLRRSASESLRLLEKEFDTLSSIAHAYNRELKTFDG